MEDWSSVRRTVAVEEPIRAAAAARCQGRAGQGCGGEEAVGGGDLGVVQGTC